MEIQIQQKFCLLFWYVKERNWSVQNCNTIVQPRCEPDDYKQGDLVKAKFKGNAYHAAIVRIGDNKDDLKEDQVKLEEFLKDLTLSPDMVMQKMGVIVTTKMDANDTNETNISQVPLVTVTKKRKTTAESKVTKKTKLIEKKNISNDQDPTIKSVKQQEKEKQLAAIETSKIMAKKLLGPISSDICEQDIQRQTTIGSDVSQQDIRRPTTIGNDISQQDIWRQTTIGNDISRQDIRRQATMGNYLSDQDSGRQAACSKQPASSLFETHNTCTDTTHTNTACLSFSTLTPVETPRTTGNNTESITFNNGNFNIPVPEVYNQAYSTINAPTPSYTELLNSATDDWIPSTGLFFNQPEQHAECKSKISYLEDKVKRLQNKVDFLEGKLLEDFLSKLSTKVKSTSDSVPNSECTVSTGGVVFHTGRTSSTNGAVSNPGRTHSTSLTSSAVSTSGASQPNCTIPESHSPLSVKCHQSPSDTSFSPQQLVDLAPGYQTRISSGQLNTCIRKARGSATALARLLLVVYFDADTLSKSCARGTSGRAALDQDKLDAIIKCCVDFSKGKTPEKDIIQAINGKCSDLRQEKMKLPKTKK